MAIIAKNAGGSDFKPCPEGTFIGICYRVLDIGTQKFVFQGHEKEARKVILTWEIPEEPMEDGRPFSVHKRFTLSLHEKSKLRPVLEAWRGKKFSEPELEGFDIAKLLGVAAMLTVVHDQGQDGKVRADVASIARPPKGIQIPKLTNPVVEYSIEQGKNSVFQSLGEGLQKTICGCVEWNKPTAAVTEPDGDDKAQGQGEVEDDVPF